MKKILKSKIFWTALILISAASIYFIANQNVSSVEYVTRDVEIGSIKQTVSATGQIKSASQIELNFKNAGRLTELNTDTGDRVARGDVLAKLKATDLVINVSSAQANLQEAQANLDKVKAGATQQDIAVSEAAVEKSESDLDSIKVDLLNTEAVYSQAIENENQNILVDLGSVLTKINIALQDVYDTLNYKGDDANFKTSRPSDEINVEENYAFALIKVDEAELAYNLAKLDHTDLKIDDAVAAGLEALSETKSAVDKLGDLLDYVIITSMLSQSELNTLKTTINTQRTTIDTTITTIQVAKNDLATARLNYQTKVEAGKNAVLVAERNLEKSKADLEFKKSPARPEDVSLYQARVNRALADLRLAQDRYNDTILEAPIDGVVTEVNYSVGEQTSAATPVIRMLAEETYEIEVDIPESDITKIEVSDQVEITLDAFSDKEVFIGLVTTINPAQTEIQDVIYYKVTVSFNAEQSSKVADLVEKIKPGMTANIIIETASVEDVLVIPYRAVKDRGGKRVVEVLENGFVKEQEVSIGIRGDEGLVELISGLNEGQSVITFVKDNSK